MRFAIRRNAVRQKELLRGGLLAHPIVRPVNLSGAPDKSTHLDDILVGEGLVGFVVLGVLEENLVHVGARVLVQLVTGAEDNQRDLAVAQHRQFVRLLHHAEFPLVKGHLSHIKAEMMRARALEGELVSGGVFQERHAQRERRAY